MGWNCNQRVFETTLSASIACLKTTLSASETAISGTGLQSTALGPHYLQLNSTSQQAIPPCAGRPTVLVLRIDTL